MKLTELDFLYEEIEKTHSQDEYPFGEFTKDAWLWDYNQDDDCLLPAVVYELGRHCRYYQIAALFDSLARKKGLHQGKLSDQFKEITTALHRHCPWSYPLTLLMANHWGETYFDIAEEDDSKRFSKCVNFYLESRFERRPKENAEKLKEFSEWFDYEISGNLSDCDVYRKAHVLSTAIRRCYLERATIDPQNYESQHEFTIDWRLSNTDLTARFATWLELRRESQENEPAIQQSDGPHIFPRGNTALSNKNLHAILEQLSAAILKRYGGDDYYEQWSAQTSKYPRLSNFKREAEKASKATHQFLLRDANSLRLLCPPLSGEQV